MTDDAAPAEAPQKPAVAFWFDPASTYSHIAAQRVEAEADARGAVVRWRPFLLGPIFAANGWDTSPFNLFPAKGRNMWRDMERLCARHGLPPVTRTQRMPQHSVLAARTALALEGPARAAFCRGCYMAQFAKGKDIAEPESLAAVLSELGEDAEAVLARAQSVEVKAALRANVEEAMSLGIYGAPSFVTEDGELFWGNDRLEDALDWAAGRSVRP